MNDELADEKKFYQRFYALHKNKDLVQVFKKFGIAAFRRSSVLEGFEDFIAANKFGGKVCVEIGTLHGLTACILVRHFDRVITIDIEDSPLKRKIAAALKIKNVEFIEIADNAAKRAVIADLGDFDAAYVDGDHARDTALDFQLVRSCGRVLFHEYWNAQPDVRGLVNGLRVAGGHIVTEGKLALWTN